MLIAPNCIAVIPCLNEAESIGRVVSETLRHVPAVLVVDDGSDDQTSECAVAAGASVLRRNYPGGKGSALNQGFQRGIELGFTWALTLDGDGQHCPADIPGLLQKARSSGARMVVGDRMGTSHDMPWVRRWVNRWMSEQLSSVCGADWPDTQCGFRLLRLDSWAATGCRSQNFQIESELLVRFAVAGFCIEYTPVQTKYGRERSKIHPLRDSWRWFRWWREIRRELENREQIFAEVPAGALQA